MLSACFLFDGELLETCFHEPPATGAQTGLQEDGVTTKLTIAFNGLSVSSSMVKLQGV
jgi:hypothetical protein